MANANANELIYYRDYHDQHLQCFALIQLLTSGGPVYCTSTVMYGVYEQAFMLGHFGYASAMGVILAIVIGIISIIQFKYFGSDVEY